MESHLDIGIPWMDNEEPLPVPPPPPMNPTEPPLEAETLVPILPAHPAGAVMPKVAPVAALGPDRSEDQREVDADDPPLETPLAAEESAAGEDVSSAAARPNKRKVKTTIVSRYKGVSWNAASRKWIAQIKINGKQVSPPTRSVGVGVSLVEPSNDGAFSHAVSRDILAGMNRKKTPLGGMMSRHAPLEGL